MKQYEYFPMKLWLGHFFLKLNIILLQADIIAYISAPQGISLYPLCLSRLFSSIKHYSATSSYTYQSHMGLYYIPESRLSWLRVVYL